MGFRILDKNEHKAKSYKTGNVRRNIATIRHVCVTNVATEKQ